MEENVSSGKGSDNSVTSQVLEYYSKFSQSKNLPRYFCSSSDKSKGRLAKTANSDDGENLIVPEVRIQGDGPKWPRPPLIGQDRLHPERNNPDNNNSDEKENDNPADSPTSSLASNRKLEWDNGADIGYKNAEKSLQKSLSLPVLSTLERVDLHKDLLRFSPEGVIADASSQQPQQQQPGPKASEETSASYSNCKKQNTNSTSTQSSSDRFSGNTVSSSSTNSHKYNEDRTKFSGSGSSSDVRTKSILEKFLNQDVGEPIAESTPLIKSYSSDPEICAPYCETPALGSQKNCKKLYDNIVRNEEMMGKKSKHPESGRSTDSTKKIGHSIKNVENRLSFPRNKIFKLQISRPIYVECVDEELRRSDKAVQTFFDNVSPRDIQTDVNFNGTPGGNQGDNKPSQKRTVLYAQHKDLSRAKRSTSSSVQTDSDVVLSNCESFEYVDAGDYNPKQKSGQEGENIKPKIEKNNTDKRLREFLLENLKKRLPSEKSSDTFSENNTLSKRNPLAGLICNRNSNRLSEDIDKSIELIKRLIKSKNYDKVTKKHYVDKIIKKIIENNYSDDSSGSYSGPKFELNTEKRRIPPSATTSDTSKDEVPITPRSGENNTEVHEKYLQENKPWVPVQKTSPKVDVIKKPVKKVLHFQTFSDEIIPSTSKTEGSPKNDVASLKTLIEEQPVLAHGKLKRSHYTIASDDLIQSIRCCKGMGDSHEYSSDSLVKPVPLTKSEGQTLKQDFAIPVKDVNPKKLNWKEDKTRSEESLERFANRVCGDRLIEFAKTEKKHQLSWISSEIIHLNKLKKLLESECKSSENNGESPELTDNKHKQEYEMKDGNKVTTEVLLKPNAGELKNVETTTTLYMIKTERSKEPKQEKRQKSKLVLKKELNQNKTVKTPYFDHKDSETCSHISSPEEGSRKQCKNGVEDPKGSNLIGSGESTTAPSSLLSPEPQESNRQDPQPKHHKMKPWTSNGSLAFDIKSARLISDTIHRIELKNDAGRTAVRRFIFEVPEKSNNITEQPPKEIKQAKEESVQKDTTDRCEMGIQTKEKTVVSVGVGGESCLLPKENKDHVSISVTEVEKRNQGTITSNVSNQDNSNGRERLEKSRETKKEEVDKRNQGTITRNVSNQDNNGKERLEKSREAKKEGKDYFEINEDDKEIDKTRHFTIDTRVVSIKGAATNDKKEEPLTKESVETLFSKNMEIFLPNLESFNKIVEKLEHLNLANGSSGEEKASETSKHKFLRNGASNDHKDSEDSGGRRNSLTDLQDPISSEGSTVSLATCCCCKRRYDDLSKISSEKIGEKVFVLCSPCNFYRQTVQDEEQLAYENSDHVCKCFKADYDLLQEVRKAILELNKLEKQEKRCSKCLYEKHKQKPSYCSQCNGKIKEKERKPVAYTLVFEENSRDKVEQKRKAHRKTKRRRSLEEIRIKIPYPYTRRRKEELNDDRKDDGEDTEKYDTDHEDDAEDIKDKDKKHKKMTLQEYLSVNKPSFIQSAEERRRCLYELALIREKKFEKYKQLLALTEGISSKNICNENDANPKKLFTWKEIRKMTAKKYKQLPEVQQKIKDAKKEQIKSGNRVLLNIFNKNLKERVLKGETDLSLRTSVIEFL